MNCFRAFHSISLVGVAVAATVLLSSCVSTYRLIPSRQDDVETLVIQGRHWVVKNGPTILTAVSGEKAQDGNMSFLVFIQNKSQYRFDVDPRKFKLLAKYTISPSDSEAMEKYLEIRSPDAIIDTLKFNRNLVVGLNAASAAFQASQAASRQSTTYYNGTAYGANGAYGSFSAKSVTTTNDPLAAMQAQQIAIQNAQSTSANMTAQIDYYDRVLLRANTLFPGTSVMGVVLAEGFDADVYTLEMPLATRNVRFEFEQLSDSQ